MDEAVIIAPTSLQQYAGIPYVYYGRTWGTFCLENFDINAALVFCKNLGYQDVAYITSSDNGPAEPIPTIINTVSCTGDEEYFTECPQIEWAYQGQCTRERNPIVVCQIGEKSTSIVQTIPGFPEYGRVEVTITEHRFRGTICNDTMTQAVADVVCRDAGFLRGARRFFTIGEGQTWYIFENVSCTGDEDSFTDCRSHLVSVHESNCNHNQDMGVECFANDNDLIFLLSGAGSYEGAVAYRERDRRALLCDGSWTNREASVVCRMIGYESGTVARVIGVIPDTFDDVFQWDVVCAGDEERLEDCTVTKRETPTTCAPGNIAQIRCGPNENGNLRITGSGYTEQGRVEIYQDGQWAHVWLLSIFMDKRFYDRICIDLGYEKSVYQYLGIGQMPFEAGSGTAGRMCEYVPSTGRVHCQALTNQTGGGEESQVGVVCKPFDIVAYHPIRLVDMKTDEVNNKSGYVEMYHDGQWRGICENILHSDLVCSEFGHADRSHAAAIDTSVIADGSSELSSVWFSFTETTFCDTLYGCRHSAWGHPLSDCNKLAVQCVEVEGRASSLESLTLSVILLAVAIAVDLGFIHV
ncbi:scavenger receptor cysteine-rich domain superfamily protein-like [Lytechinus pictus]|uniref:scavenger receptor cysteine-rich domain superfamily protein-like n=1 Tax=Lytechinus pictus TaxID=7653 RepID=UPI0030B9FEEB